MRNTLMDLNNLLFEQTENIYVSIMNVEVQE